MQTKGNKSSITYYTPMKLHVHNTTIVIVYVQFSISFMKFHQLVIKLCLRMEKIIEIYAINGNNSSITHAALMKHHADNHVIVIYIYYKFDKIQYTDYLVMAEDGKNH